MARGQGMVAGAVVPLWLSEWMAARNIVLWGAADLQGFVTPLDAQGQGFPCAISLAFPMPPALMNSLHAGPNQAYADEYSRVNARINQVATELAEAMTARGCRARALAASVRSDTVNIKGDFPHKTAATRAGLGCGICTAACPHGLKTLRTTISSVDDGLIIKGSPIA